MDPLTIGILMFLGGIILGGGGVHTVEARDKKALRQSNAKLEDALQSASNRNEELRQRLGQQMVDNVTIAFKYYTQKLENYLLSAEVRIGEHVQVQAIVLELESLGEKLSAGQDLSDTDKRFFGALTSIINNPEMTSSADVRWVNEYTASRHLNDLSSMLRRIFAKLLRKSLSDAKALREEQHNLIHEVTSLESKAEIEGLSDLEDQQIASLRKRLAEMPKDIKELEEQVRFKKMLLVVVTKQAILDAIEDQTDRMVLEILDRTVNGKPLAEEDMQILKLYATRHFPEVKIHLAKHEGIELYAAS